jgi:glycosyltransferase involved in cell wall biosynthesis
MRICSPQLGISPLSRLGGEVFDREILKGMAKLGVQVQILLPENPLPVEAVSGWEIYRTTRHCWNYYEYNWIFLRKLLGLARDPGFDLLRIHSPTLAPLGWVFKRLTGRPVTAQIHHLDRNRVAGWMAWLILHACDLITTDSQFSRQQIIERYHVLQERIQVVSPGVDEKFCPQPANEHLAEQSSQMEGPGQQFDPTQEPDLPLKRWRSS